MEDTAVPKIPSKLITRSKAKSSTGYRQIVNFLDNLSRDETGAPVKWKFNKSGVKLARGIGKKIADAGKQGTALKYDARTSIVKAVLKKKYVSKQSGFSSENQLRRKSTSQESENNTDLSNEGDSQINNVNTFSTEGDRKFPSRVGRPPKMGKYDGLHSYNNSDGKVKLTYTSNLGNVDSKTATIPRKRGRPPKKPETTDNSVNIQNNIEAKGKVQSWTNLNQKVFKRTFIGKLMKTSLEGLSCDESADSDSRVDSEVETESVGSSISSASLHRRKKLRTVNRTGIMLGPRKLLRSQDNLITRKSRGMKASVLNANRKPRKRTLSGEFELLDESLLRKKLRQDEDRQSDLDSDISESIQKNLSKLEDSDLESFASDTKVLTEITKSSCESAKDSSDQKNSLVVHDGLEETNLYTSSVLDHSVKNSDSIVAQPRKRGRPPKINKQLPSSTEPYPSSIKPSLHMLQKPKLKVFGPKCAQERARNLQLQGKCSQVRRPGLQIIGPGGLVFMRKPQDQTKKEIFSQVGNFKPGFQPKQETVSVASCLENTDIVSKTSSTPLSSEMKKENSEEKSCNGIFEINKSQTSEKKVIMDSTKPESEALSKDAVKKDSLLNNNVQITYNHNNKEGSDTGGSDTAVFVERDIFTNGNPKQDYSFVEGGLPFENGSTALFKREKESDAQQNEYKKTDGFVEIHGVLPKINDEEKASSTTVEDVDSNHNANSHESVSQLDSSSEGKDTSGCDIRLVAQSEDRLMVPTVQESVGETLEKITNEKDNLNNIIHGVDDHQTSVQNEAIVSKNTLAIATNKESVNHCGEIIGFEGEDKGYEVDTNLKESDQNRGLDTGKVYMETDESLKMDEKLNASKQVNSISTCKSLVSSETLDTSNTLQKTPEVESYRVSQEKCMQDSCTSEFDAKQMKCLTADRNENLEEQKVECGISLNCESVPHAINKHEQLKDLDDKSGKTTPVSEDDHADSINDKEKKRNTKREFQLRQKASRSPLEIIAMRQSQEERQYILEQTRKAMKREEKQKRMREKIKKIENNERIRDEMPFGEILEDQINEVKEGENLVKEIDFNECHEKQEELHMTPESSYECKPCSVVLIDFVKYLKMTNSSYSVETGSVMEEWETIEDTETIVTDQEDSADDKTIDDVKDVDRELVPETSKEDSNTQIEVYTSAPELDKVDIDRTDDIKPLKKKRKPSARKQARPVTYSAQLTAEIVSSPIFLGDESQTVPPLRLKIKQNIIAKPKPHRTKRGLKFTVKKRHSARKGMSSAKPISRKYFESLQLDNMDRLPLRKGKVDDFVKGGLPGSVEDSQHNKNQDEKIKQSRKYRSKAVSQTFSFETITDEENALSKNSEQDDVVTFQCTHQNCGFVSTTRRIMESHVYVHLKDIPFRCVHCNQVFQSRSQTFLHMRNIHPHLDARMEAAEKVDEHLYYREVKQLLQTLKDNGTSSPEAAVINVMMPETSASTGCYCCSHCDFSAPNQQDILDHIHNSHTNDIQYTCSLCNKAITGFKEGITKHFAEEHPTQQVTYNYLPEFYDVTKTAQVVCNADKGNIFDKMSDLFPKNTRPPGFYDGRSFQKTSAEADSTTAEMEDTDRKGEVVDGIEELAKNYTPSIKSYVSDVDKTTVNAVPNIPLQSKGSIRFQGVNNGNGFQQPVLYQDQSVIQDDDMGLKIVDVVSLSDLPNTWNQQTELSHDKSRNGQDTGKKQIEETGPGTSVNNKKPQEADGSFTKMQSGHQKQNLLQQNQAQKYKLNQDGKQSDKVEQCGTTYKCEKCSVHAPVLSAMVEHLRVTHKDIQRLFLCPYCRQYEGTNEPEIHRHIKQFHHSPDQKSPPVALSSAAKKHLRTIQVPVDSDAKKVGDKFVVEKDIYKCLKCHKHMPSLNYIYDHLEKAHHEVFVYVCPYCKIFKAKTEEHVFHHIKNVHKKCTEDIMLSLAIEENLFTRVQSLVKEKGSGRSSQSSKFQSHQGTKPTLSSPMPAKDVEDEVIVVGESRKLNMQTNSPVMSSKLVRQNIPLAQQQARMRMPHQYGNPPPAHFQQSKSSLRKSTPHHIPPHTQSSEKDLNEQQNYQQFNIPRYGSAAQRMVQASVPPPLMRAPPPLLRFPTDVRTVSRPPNSQPVGQYAGQTTNRINSPPFSTSNHRPLMRHTSPNMSKSVSPHNRQVSPSGTSQSAVRPVLRVPSVPTPNRQQHPAGGIVPASYQEFNRNSGTGTAKNKSEGYAPLDLSKSPAPVGQKEQNEDADDIPPDAFQIFNLRPAIQPQRMVRHQIPQMTMPNMPPIGYQAMRMQQQQMSRMSPHMQQAAQHRSMMTRPPPYPNVNRHVIQNTTVPRPYLKPTDVGNLNILPKEAPNTGQSDISKDNRDVAGISQMRVFKCPYCPDIVPLGMGEVAPHIEKVHPGHSIVFMKIDK